MEIPGNGIIGNPWVDMFYGVVQIDLDFSPLRSEEPKKLISLMTASPSLEQAGGLQRMTLRGHTGGVKKVLVTPGGVDVITGHLSNSTLNSNTVHNNSLCLEPP